MSFIAKGPSPKSHVAFCCHSVWGSSSVFPWLSWHWHFWGLQASYFVDCFSVWVFLIHLWQEYYRGDALFFVLHCIRYHVILICFIIRNFNADHLIKISICFSTLKLMFSPCNKYYVGRFFETIRVSYSSSDQFILYITSIVMDFYFIQRLLN